MRHLEIEKRCFRRLGCFKCLILEQSKKQKKKTHENGIRMIWLKSKSIKHFFWDCYLFINLSGIDLMCLKQKY